MNRDDRAAARWSNALTGRGGLILVLLSWASAEVMGEQTATPASAPAVPRSVSFWMQPSSTSADGSKSALPWFRAYYQDPGLMRREYYDGPIPPEQKTSAPLRHYELRNLVDGELRCDDVQPNRRPVAIERHVVQGNRYRRMPYNVADWWKRIQAIVTNPARKVGQERVAGVVTTVYEAAGVKLQGALIGKNDPLGKLRIWIDPKTQQPVRIRWQKRYEDGRVVTHTMEDVRWDVDFPKDFFEVPRGCEIYRTEDLYYPPPGTRLRGTFKCYVANGPTVYTEADITEVVIVEISPQPYVFRVHFRLADAVHDRWKKIQADYPEAAVWCDFNGQLKLLMRGWAKDLRLPRSMPLGSLRASRRSFMVDYLAIPPGQPGGPDKPEF